MPTLEAISMVERDDNGDYVRPKVKKLPSEHKPYKLNGKRIAGTTTISGRDPEGKQVLIIWANKKGLEGVCSIAFLNHSANIGTMAHKMVEAHLCGVNDETDIGVWTKWLYGEHEYFYLYYSYAVCAFRKYLTWRTDNPTFIPLEMELSLVDENLKYGGMIDFYGELEGKKVLVDIKTSNHIYSSHLLQVGGGYDNLLKVNDYDVDDVYILNISRDKDEPYEFRKIENTKECFNRFKALLKDYYLEKKK